MSPVAAALTLSRVAPSISPDPGPGGLSASMTPIHFFGTGGLLFAVVAVVSVAAYLHRGRGTANASPTNNGWTSLSTFLSSLRLRGPAAGAGATAGTDWPVDLEVGSEHVSMVYARFFHPTSWNLVECHPGTPSTPTICVEVEADCIPASVPAPPGSNSFLDMDSEQKGEKDGDDGLKSARKIRDRDARAKAASPYDMSSATTVDFSSKIIGTTVRQGVFLSVPGEEELVAEDPASETLSSDSSLDSELDFDCSPYDGIATIPEPLEGLPRTGTRRYGMVNMAYFAQSLKDTILDEDHALAYLARSLEDMFPDEGYPLVATISRGTGLADITDCRDMDLAPQLLEHETPVIDNGACTHEGRGGSVEQFREPLENFEPVDDDPRTENDDISTRQSSNDDERANLELADTDEVLEMMRQILAELRDPNLDCTPRALCDDSDFEYHSEDEYDDEDVWAVSRDPLAASPVSTPQGNSFESSIYCRVLTPPRKTPTYPEGTRPLNVRKAHKPTPGLLLSNQGTLVVSPWQWATSLHSTCCISRDGCCAEGPIYPSTPSLKTSMYPRGVFEARKAHKRSPAPPWLGEDIPATLSRPSDSPCWDLVHAGGQGFLVLCGPRFSPRPL